MKKILLTSMALAGCVSAFGQGVVLFENNANSTSYITLTSANGTKTSSGLVVELLWFNGSSYVLQSTYTQSTTPATLGQFQAGQITVTAPLGKDTFEVAGFYTSGGKAYTGTTAPFFANVNTGGPTSPVQGIDTGYQATGGWNGNLVLTAPEPSTIALGGLGAAALLLFRRRK